MIGRIRRPSTKAATQRLPTSLGLVRMGTIGQTSHSLSPLNEDGPCVWGCGVEVVSASNDDGVDAIILLKRRLDLEGTPDQLVTRCSCRSRPAT